MPEMESSSHGPETTVEVIPVSASGPDTVSASTSSGVSEYPVSRSPQHHLHLQHQEGYYYPSRSRSHTAESVATTATAATTNTSRSQSHLATATTTPGLTNQPFPPLVTSPIKRKPLSATASSLATALQSPLTDLPKPDTRFSRSPSVDSPTLYDLPSTAEDLAAFQTFDFNLSAIPEAEPHPRSIPTQSQQLDASSSVDVEEELSDVLSDYGDAASESTPDASPDVTTAIALDDKQHGSEPVIHTSNHNSNPPMLSSKLSPPNLTLEKVDTTVATKENGELQSPNTIKPSSTPQLNKPLPKSPNNAALANIIGWGNASPSATDFSSLPSPSTPTRGGELDETKYSRNSDANVSTANALGYCESYLSTPPPQVTASSVHIEEMEDELKAISSELAASIRREIDLEDLVDRLQEQANNPQAPGKRTSDYFSDSGYSSAKLSDYDQSREEIEKIQRRSEQEKASLRLELTNKLQDERQRRKELDQQVKQLSERASEIDLAQINNLDANGRLKELETTCEDLRRKLSEERQSKTNIEDLLSALKSELESACNERDNLKDEIVPQLRARVEGLEAEATSHAHLTYESTKMQHQLQSLQQENTSLRNSTAGIEDLMRRPGALQRSDSGFRGQLPAAARPDNKNLQSESREALAERLKDVEAQRDALHSALKNLLDRQEFQTRENRKKINILENERQRLLTVSPKRAGFEKDISKLRTEINVLRRRAEDALEQKWQVEKGLGGLKMDLDRAEEEITTLKGLLKEKDILVPPSSSSPGGAASTITSASLQSAYDDLQSQYNESLQRIKKLEESTGAGQDQKTKQALQRLERSLNSALSERDAARVDVDGLQNQYDSLASSAAKNVDSERVLADELTESATRVEQLAAQVRSQLSTNSELRQRLADAVSRGELDRKINSDRIANLQERLRGLEDQLVNAQSSSEDHIGRHEDEIAKLKEAHNEQLRRLNNGGGVGMTGSQKGSILNGNNIFGRNAQNIPSKSFEEESEVKRLRERVAELEKALADTENEMQEVVNKMSTAQIEVMNLQEEREAAIRETKRLQGMVKQEQSSPFASQLRMLGMAA